VGVVVSRRKQELTPAQVRELRRILAALDRAEAGTAAARDRFAAFADEHGQSAVARELNITPQSVQKRIAKRRRSE
jgi:hypothetical protein